MGIEFASWTFLLHLLLVMCAHGIGAREMTENHLESLKDHNYESNQAKIQDPKENIILKYPVAVGSDGHHKKMNALDYPITDVVSNEINVLRLHSMDGDSKDDHHSFHAKDANQGMHTKHVHAYPSSHMDHMDPSLMVFFTMNDLKVGKTIPIYFPKKDLSTSPHLLPREEADSIPFSLKELPYLQKFFSFSQDSPQGKAMEDTLRQCEIEPIKGETKFCATSLESMLDFAFGIFGLESNIKVVATNHLTKSTIHLQNYTILEVPKDISAPKMVACHTMPYPYAVFYCHSQETENKVFKVSLGGENGDRVEALAVCHMDTSHWSRNHVSFRVLGIEPGSSHVCHFFPADHLVLVPMPTPVSSVFAM